MELRALRIGRGVVGRSFASTWEEVEKFSLKYGRDTEIYFGVAPRIQRGRGGGVANCGPPAALWVDADNEQTVRAELALFDLDPSIIVKSGMGLHLYWLLKDSPRDMGMAKLALRQLARRLEGDMKSAEPAHVLRVPGTMNHKYSPPRQVEIEHIDLRRRYSLAEINAAVTPTSAAFVKGRAYMSELPPAVQGEHGDDATYRAACVLVRDLGLSHGDALTLMLEWNQRCTPPWSEAELSKKIQGAEAYGTGDKGAADPAADFVEFGPESDGGSGNGNFLVPETNLTKLSKMFKAVDDDGALRIFHRTKDETLGHDVWRRYRRTDFLEVCKSVLKLPLIQCGEKGNGEPKHMPIAEYWLDQWQGKQTFRGMTMRPEYSGELTPDGMLNMWTGFAFKPRQSSWVILKSLIFEDLCRWDTTSYDYIMNWMARAVQRPWEPAGTALVFRGKKGTGKGTLGRAFIRLFGQHGAHFASRELLTGRFNWHLMSTVALFADEAFYAGDKAGESVLKAFITEPALMYERKGKDPVMGRNCLHIIMASNLDWVVPAGMDNERRFAVFEVEEDSRDRQFWDVLYRELNEGGMPAMLHELMHRDISGFNQFFVPQTDALAAQKVHAMDHMAAWLLDMAGNGWQDFGENEKENAHLVDDIYDSFMRYCDERNVHQRQNKTSFGISLKKYMPKDFPKKFRIVKEDRQRYFYVLPDAEEVEKYIRKMLGIEQGEQENA